MHSMQYAYRDRRARKGDFRKLWIQRINAAARAERHELQPLHRRPAPGRGRGRPQGPGRPGRDRRRGVRRPGRRGQAALGTADAPTPPSRSRPPPERWRYSHQRVRRLRRLLRKRATRWAERAFVVEGAELVADRPRRRRRARVGLRRGRGGRRPRRRRAGRPWPRTGHPGLRAGARGGREGGRHRHPPAGARRSFADGRPRRSPASAPAPGLVRGRASTCATRATPARCCAPPTPPASTPWSAAAGPSTRTTRRPSARRPARSSTCRWSSAGDPGETLDAVGRPGLRRLGAVGPRRRGLRDRRLARSRPPSCSATRRPACPTSLPRSTARSASPWPGGPSRSTSAWPAPCSASRPCASGAATRAQRRRRTMPR